MIKNKLLLFWVLSFIVLPACQTPAGSSALEPPLPTQASFFTPAPVIPTAMQSTKTSAPKPTETPASTDTVIPMTATTEPFLPKGLALIDSENIVDLSKIGIIPTMGIYALAFSKTGNKLATLSERWQDRSRYMDGSGNGHAY